MKKLISAILILAVFLIITDALAESPAPDYSGIAAGDVIIFGSYEQDNNPDNGPEPIEWVVLDVQDGKALLQSRYILDAKAYNTERVDVTWEQCTLRFWLNNDFLNAAFSEAEQRAILMTDVDNSESQGTEGWPVRSENMTQDYVFLPSFYDAETYYTDLESRMRAPTEFAVESGVWPDEYHQADGLPTGAWWLRSSYSGGMKAGVVLEDGDMNYYYELLDYIGVSPALWIDLESDIF